MNSSWFWLPGIVMAIVVRRHTLASLAPAQCKSSCVTACLTHLTVLVGERIDFFLFFLFFSFGGLKQSLSTVVELL